MKLGTVSSVHWQTGKANACEIRRCLRQNGKHDTETTARFTRRRTNGKLTDAVENASLVVQRLSALSNALFTGAEGTEVLGSFGGFAEETKDDASLLATGDFDVEEDLCLDGLAKEKREEES